MPIAHLRLVAAMALVSGLSAAGAVVARDKLFNLR
jgi:energy-converting hydrogenase Eha subunit H